MPDEVPVHWQSPPPVNAPSPDNQSEAVAYDISNDITSRDSPNFQLTPIFQVWSHLHGQVPPIKNVSILEFDEVKPTLQTLHDATSCFKGINRPINKQENGNEVVTYVLKPETTVEYEPRMGAPIRANILGDGYVLTVQIVLKPSLQLEGNNIRGRVTRIEIVESDAANDSLPKNHKDRYGDRLW